MLSVLQQVLKKFCRLSEEFQKKAQLTLYRREERIYRKESSGSHSAYNTEKRRIRPGFSVKWCCAGVRGMP